MGCLAVMGFMIYCRGRNSSVLIWGSFHLWMCRQVNWIYGVEENSEAEMPLYSAFFPHLIVKVSTGRSDV